MGDSLGGQKADARLVDRALSAAVEKGAKQFILVTPQGAGANPIGFLGNLFGGGGSSKKPSKIEQQVESPDRCLHEGRCPVERRFHCRLCTCLLLLLLLLET